MKSSTGRTPRTARRTLRLPRRYHELGQLARRRGDLAEAESRLGEAIAVRRAFFGEQHVLTAESLAALGAARLAGKEPSSAQPLLEAAVVTLRRTLSADHPVVVFATRDLERARQTSAPAR